MSTRTPALSLPPPLALRAATIQRHTIKRIPPPPISPTLLQVEHLRTRPKSGLMRLVCGADWSERRMETLSEAGEEEAAEKKGEADVQESPQVVAGRSLRAPVQIQLTRPARAFHLPFTALLPVALAAPPPPAPTQVACPVAVEGTGQTTENRRQSEHIRAGEGQDNREILKRAYKDRRAVGEEVQLRKMDQRLGEVLEGWGF
ncbi:hypothetical protein JCM11641_003002 [Rhodosporidiobolus odoratus]